MQRMRELSGFFRGLIANCLPDPVEPAGPVGETKPINLNSLFSGATGFAMERDGFLNVDTISDNKISCMILGLELSGIRVSGACEKSGCDCLEQGFKAALPDARVVEVDIKIIAGD
jgi:hypothetical protein